MKKKKWLLVIVAILFLINIAFYGIVRWGKADQIVKGKIEDYLKTALNADIVIDDFTFNDKQLNITGFHVNSSKGDYSLDVRQIFVEYDLPMLIFSNFTNYKAIEEIKVFEPLLKMQISPPQDDGDKTEIPDIARFFKHLSLYNGRAEISYRDETVEASVIADTLDLKLKNTNKTSIQFTVRNQDGSSAKGDITLSKGEFTLLDINARQLAFNYLKIKGLEELDLTADFDLNRQKNILTVTGSLNDVALQTNNRSVQLVSLPFTVKENTLTWLLEGASLDDNTFTGSGKITDFLKPVKQISAELEALDIPIHNYLSSVQGNASARVYISGSNFKPTAEIFITSDLLEVYEQQLQDISLQGVYRNDSLSLNLDQLNFSGNLLNGSGSFTKENGLIFDLSGKNFSWQEGELTLTGNIRTSLDLKNDLKAQLQVRDLKIQYNRFQLDEMELKGDLVNSDFNLELYRKKSDLQLNLSGDLSHRRIETELEFFRFDPAQVFNNNALPLLSGSMTINADSSWVRTYSSIRVFDRNYASLNGRLILDSFLDLKTEKVSISLKTSKAHFSFEPFSLNIIAEGDLDSLNFKQVNINREIFLSGYAAFGKEKDIDLKLSFASLDLQKYLKYFSDYSFNNSMEGKASLELHYKSSLSDSISGFLNIKDFSYDNSRKININSELNGSLSKMNATSSIMLDDKEELFTIRSGVTLLPSLTYNIFSNIRELDLSRIFKEEKITGILNADLDYCHQCGERTLELKTDITDLNYGRITADSIHVDLKQGNRLLEIRDIRALQKGRYSLQASGRLGYNLLLMNIYPDTNIVKLSFEGDPFKILSKNSKILTEASSECTIDLEIGLEEKGLSIKKGNLQLNNGSAKIASQMEKLEKVKLDLNIENNELSINSFTGKMGVGRFYIENQISYEADEFVLGNLQIGKLFLYTNDDGLDIHLPNYMPGNSVANAVIRGRNSDKMVISGPFDDIFINGDVYFYNGSANFPADSENLVKFVAKMTEEKKEFTSYDIPLKLDLILHFQDNIRYVTYPLNLLVDPGSYMNLKFDNERFSVTDAEFTSESGYIDIFGTQMTADYVQVNISPYEERLKVNGLFYQKASDGTLITLLVTSRNEASSGKFFALDFDLRSDDPNDSRTDILALLRYGRRQDEISPDQRSAILQDEVIQLAGLGIEIAVIDPFISPVETWIRRLLRLDFFHLQTDLIQNIFSRYSSDRTDYVVDEEGQRLSHNTSELFLNNLSIGMGKYLSRKVFLDYELEFQKPQDISVQSDMGVYHNISVRYDLPYSLKLAYKFHILPFNEKNTHEISLERSFRF